jgi:hypothetical protein
VETYRDFFIPTSFRIFSCLGSTQIFDSFETKIGYSKYNLIATGSAVGRSPIAVGEVSKDLSCAIADSTNSWNSYDGNYELAMEVYIADVR